MNDAFQVKVGEFEGPLDLLLSLIERRKMHISDVSLAMVTDGYLEHMRAMTDEGSYKHMADFVAVAATLLLIKSLSLLPGLAVAPEETVSIQDLENRLREYQRIKELSRHVSARFGKRVMLPRGEIKETPGFKPGPGITQQALLECVKGIIRSFPKLEHVPKAVIGKAVSLEDVLTRLLDRVQGHMSTTFREFMGDHRSRNEVVVSFLAVLELVRRGAVNVEQETDFGDIRIETQLFGTPRYGH